MSIAFKINDQGNYDKDKDYVIGDALSFTDEDRSGTFVCTQNCKRIPPPHPDYWLELTDDLDT